MGFSIKDMIRGQGIIGAGLSWGNKRLRLSLSIQEEESLRVLALKEASLEEPDAKKIKALLKKWKIPKRSKFALAIEGAPFHLRKIELSTAEEENSETLIAEKLQDSLSGVELNLNDWDYRLVPVEFEQESGDTQEYLAYFMEQASLKSQKKTARQSGLSIKVGELAPVSAAAWLETLLEDTPKVTALLYLDSHQISFVGLTQGQISFYEHAAYNQKVDTQSSSPHDSLQESSTNDDFSLSEVSQMLENFLLQTGSETLDWLYLGGVYSSDFKTSLASTISVPLKDLNELNNPWVLFEEGVDPKLAGRFAAELGASLFPRSAI